MLSCCAKVCFSYEPTTKLYDALPFIPTQMASEHSRFDFSLSSNFRFGHSLDDKVLIFVFLRSPDDYFYYFSFIHSFTQFHRRVFFFARARTPRVVSYICWFRVCVFKIRLSIELMDVMTSSAVMLLYVNIVAQCKRIDKMWNIIEMRWERRRRPHQRRRADEKVLAANRSKEIIRIRRRSQWQRRPHT